MIFGQRNGDQPLSREAVRLSREHLPPVAMSGRMAARILAEAAEWARPFLCRSWPRQEETAGRTAGRTIDRRRSGIVFRRAQRTRTSRRRQAALIQLMLSW